MRTLEPSYEIVPHTAELAVRCRAASFGGLLIEAGRALAEIQLRGMAGVPAAGWRRLEVRAGDLTALLVEWLNELVYQAETTWWVATDFALDEAGPDRAVIRARGVDLDRAPGLVKAATYHGAGVREVPGGFEGEVVLDV